METITPHIQSGAGKTAFKVLSLLFMPLSFAFMELLLAHNCAFDPEIFNAPGAVLSGLALGFICDIPAFMFKNRKAGFAAALILTEIAAVYFCVQFFVYNSYTTFMDPVTIMMSQAFCR